MLWMLSCTVVSVDELRRIVREEVRRALLEVLVELLPPVDEGEEEEMERVAGKPSEYSRSSWIGVAGKKKL